MRISDWSSDVCSSDLPQSTPQSAAWWRLRNWVVWRALDRRDYALAYRISAGHGHAEGVPFADGEWQAGWLALKYMDRPTEAYQHFVTLHDGVTSAISRLRGAFWEGEAANESGRSEGDGLQYQTAATHLDPISAIKRVV